MPNSTLDALAKFDLDGPDPVPTEPASPAPSAPPPDALAAPLADAAPVALAGTVAKVAFRGERGFRIVALRLAVPLVVPGETFPLDRVTVVGTLPPVEPGDPLAVTGAWETSPRFGRQLRAATAGAPPPATGEGLAACLGALVDGFGPGTARTLLRACGGVAATLAWLDSDLSVPVGKGMGEHTCKLATEVRAVWRARRALVDADVALASLGILPGVRARLVEKYGPQAHHIAAADPYRLADDVDGIGFATADAIAQAHGVAPDSPVRKNAALRHALADDAETRGHTYATHAQAVSALQRLLPDAVIENIDIDNAAAPLVAKGVLVRSPNGALALARFVDAERAVATAVHARLRLSPTGYLDATRIAAAETMADLTLTPEQRAAVDLIRQYDFAILTGGPGTGKTTITKVTVCMFEDAGLSVALCAPTGRAAKRLMDTTGRPALTIHRLLEPAPGTAALAFTRGVSNPLDADVVLVDEASMVDAELLAALVRALRPTARLVLVGDADQLPPVGAGAPFRDLVALGGAAQDITAHCARIAHDAQQKFDEMTMDDTYEDNPPDRESLRLQRELLAGMARARLPVARLVGVHRQAAGSRIVGAAREVLAGRPPTPSPPRDRADGCLFRTVHDDPDACAIAVVDYVTRLVPETFGVPMADIMVVAPMRAGPVGVLALNARLQAAANPRPLDETLVVGDGDRRREYRMGDRVMATKNDYKRGVVNGDIGTVLALPPDAPHLPAGERVRLVATFPDPACPDGARAVPYTRAQLGALDLAYASTVHKVQGAEFRAVVVVLHGGHAHMLERSLLYTALTRAKRVCLIVGTEDAVKRAAKVARTDARRTMLPGMLRRMGENT